MGLSRRGLFSFVPLLDAASVMQLLLDPLVNKCNLVNATRRRNLSDSGPLLAAEGNRHAALRPRKDGLGDLLELVIEGRHLVVVPKLS